MRNLRLIYFSKLNRSWFSKSWKIWFLSRFSLNIIRCILRMQFAALKIWFCGTRKKIIKILWKLSYAFSLIIKGICVVNRKLRASLYLTSVFWCSFVLIFIYIHWIYFNLSMVYLKNDEKNQASYLKSEISLQIRVGIKKHHSLS